MNDQWKGRWNPGLGPKPADGDWIEGRKLLQALAAAEYWARMAAEALRNCNWKDPKKLPGPIRSTLPIGVPAPKSPQDFAEIADLSAQNAVTARLALTGYMNGLPPGQDGMTMAFSITTGDEIIYPPESAANC